MTQPINYTDFPGFGDIYLEEDSYVLTIEESVGRITFLVDAVLTPEHPRYHTPGPNEQNCYAKLWITFQDTTRIDWIKRDNRRYTDSTGESDYGIIYQLVQLGDHFEFSGDFGDVLIFSESMPSISYE